ncbi:hypothetical protein K493DRAFT_59846 [Basidiobolus meristosporus CBS 931.73]|uniref:Uncharacterized protein n=1 Tax=Basidiobolus meristosporus CBS 931.73 TaxID=1314790 RepID=A0A1Y1XX82_9FUNG|nr:hypothetical protein K493DRAFT_59846 [Basidiobolus meristosporus CBS 931.73]|eukprot:ORX90347.1 hypothetical protein K493DRAFT_59846 [Basidiobolus meristosporus CBS 931.73]
MFIQYKLRLGVFLLCTNIIPTLCQAQYQDVADLSTSISGDSEELDSETPTDNSEFQSAQESDSPAKYASGVMKLAILPVPAPNENDIQPKIQDTNGSAFPDILSDEDLPFPSEDEIESVPEEPEPEPEEVHNFTSVISNTNGRANIVNPPATLQFIIPTLGQIFQIPGTLNLSWNPIGLTVAPSVFNIEARNLVDNSIVSVVNNLPSSQRVYPWNIPQGTQEGMYRLFVYTEAGKQTPEFPGHLATYEGEVFELLYSIPPTTDKSIDFIPTSGAAISPSSIFPILIYLGFTVLTVVA